MGEGGGGACERLAEPSDMYRRGLAQGNRWHRIQYKEVPRGKPRMRSMVRRLPAVGQRTPPLSPAPRLPKADGLGRRRGIDSRRRLADFSVADSEPPVGRPPRQAVASRQHHHA
jgi:hypothetical protein